MTTDSELPLLNGSDYVPEIDHKRLSIQFWRIFSLMKDQKWRTLSDIESLTQDPPASISAQLRHMRKIRFGRHTVNKRRSDRSRSGLFEYQVVPNAYFSE